MIKHKEKIKIALIATILIAFTILIVPNLVVSFINETYRKQRYEMVMERFINGTADVTDLNTAQSEKDEAANRYIQELNNYWSYYYNIRRLTLFDYISRTNISAEFDKIVGK